MKRLKILNENGYRRVVAHEPIAKGTLVIDMSHGEAIPLAEMEDSYYAFQVSEDLFLGSRGADHDDLTCFLNHSCNPNLAFRNGDTILANIRDIAAGEELCWDYSTSIDDGLFAMECGCNSVNCRGTVNSFRELDGETQARLLPLSVRYLQEKYKPE